MSPSFYTVYPKPGPVYPDRFPMVDISTVGIVPVPQDRRRKHLAETFQRRIVRYWFGIGTLLVVEQGYDQHSQIWHTQERTVEYTALEGNVMTVGYRYLYANGPYISIYKIYKVPLREEARGVAQERNEKRPA